MSNCSTQTKINRLSWSLHLAGVVIAGIVLGLAILLIYLPFNSMQSSLDRQIESNSTFSATCAAIQSEHTELTSKQSELEQRMVELTTRIPDTSRESDFLRELTELAKETGLSIRDYRPGVLKNHDEYQELEIQFSAEADYAGLCHFLSGMSQMSRLSRITELRVETADAKTKVYPISITLIVFAVPKKSESQTAQQVGQATPTPTPTGAQS